MISTVPGHEPELQATESKNRNGQYISKPVAVIAYNEAKKGVDVSDQMSAYYTCLRKSIKWYKQVSFELVLGTCVVNSQVIYNNFGNNTKKMNILQIREITIKRLLNPENQNIESNETDDNQQPPKKAGKSTTTCHVMGR